MIIIKSQKTPFRERSSEWILSVGMFFWGLVLIIKPTIFSTNTIFTPLLVVLPQEAWASLAILTGAVRVMGLCLEKYKNSTHLRAFGAAASVTIWASLFLISVANPIERAISIVIYGMLLTVDLLALWWAAGDAKIADLKARNSTATKNGN